MCHWLKIYSGMASFVYFSASDTSVGDSFADHSLSPIHPICAIVEICG